MPWLRLALLLPLAACLIGCSAFAAGNPAAPADQPSEPTSEVLSSSGVPVELSESFRIDTYKVRGHTATEVRTDLNRTGPLSVADARRYDAMTTWSLRWALDYDRGQGGCALKGATVYLDIVMLLPELEAPDDLPAKVLSSWQAYRQALQTHEMGHVEGQRRGATDLQNALTRFEGDWNNCRDLAADLKKLGDDEVAAIFAADRKHDEVTDHGRLQGAVFP